MLDLGYEAVKRHGAPLLNYAVWAQLSFPPHKDEAPKHLKQAQEAWLLLQAEEAKAVEGYAARAWDYVSAAVTHVTYAPAEDKATRVEIRKHLPHLDDWTFEVLWSVAYRRAMQ